MVMGGEFMSCESPGGAGRGDSEEEQGWQGAGWPGEAGGQG